MPVNFNIKTKIKINGKEYAGPEEMPPDVRQLYEQALAKAGTSPQANVKSKIKFNGQSYNSPDEMPEDTRRIFESVMSTVNKDHDGIPDALQKGGGTSPSNLPVTPSQTQPDLIQPDNPNNALFITGVAVGILIILALAVLLIQMMR
jgi:hypothetical protein